MKDVSKDIIFVIMIAEINSKFIIGTCMAGAFWCRTSDYNANPDWHQVTLHLQLLKFKE